MLFPTVTRDSALLQGLLQLNDEAAHHVEEIENIIVQLRATIIAALTQAALAEPELCAFVHPDFVLFYAWTASVSHFCTLTSPIISDLGARSPSATDASATEIADHLWQRWKGDDDLISYKEFRQNLKRLHIRVGKIKLRRLLRVIDPDQSGRHFQPLKSLLIPKM